MVGVAPLGVVAHIFSRSTRRLVLRAAEGLASMSDIPKDKKLTSHQYALLATLNFSGKRARSQLFGLRGPTWASLQNRGLISARLDSTGQWHFQITDAGRELYEATP